jgi:hypothetical protein
MEVNGKTYSLWGQFVERKNEWIGGILKEINEDLFWGDVEEECETIITDITLVPNGKDSAYFSVEGEDFGCGFDVGHGGICGKDGGKGWITFGTTGQVGIKFRIKGNK